ncbi:hypothetical protein D3C85_796090 [compost metagenome]
MATDKEKALVAEIVGLATDINVVDEIDVSVDLRAHGVHVRMSPKTFDDTTPWVYYPERTAYFSNDVFTEENFEYVAGTYIAELKKHHPQYDADGVHL